jgi:molecular chaperone DnaK
LTDPIVGIDLGTSNSVVAHADAMGTVRVLSDDGGGKVHPSVVSFHPNGGVVVGAAAKQRKVIDPQNTIYSIKRLIGRSYSSPEVQTAKARSPFQIKAGANNAPTIATRAGDFAVPEISAIVLDHVRNIAAARLESPVNRAVVTVPAAFNDAQRSATATAGAIAGLTVVRVLNEPTAAALAYGHTRHLREIIAVYDFGGGTFDITLLKLEDQVYEVLGTSGDTFLGGDDLDERLVDKMVAKFLVENRIDLRTNEVSIMRLRAVAEQTKIELSRRARARVRVDEIAYGPRGAPLNLQIEITRDEFVKEVADLIDRTFPVCSEALALAQLSIDQIADVILVGGTTKMPYVRDQVGKFFGKPPRTDVNPEDAVAAGAALQASSLERILSRRASSKHAIAVTPPTEPTANTDVLALAEPGSGATMAPSELSLAARERPKRATAGYGTAANPTSDARPDTGYSVTRAGVRDAVAAPERYPTTPTTPLSRVNPAAPASPASLRPTAVASSAAGFETRTPPTNQTQPLGRITRPVPAVPPATPPYATPVAGPPPIPAPHPAQGRTLMGVPSGVPSEVEVELSSAGTAVASGPPRPATVIGTATPPPLPRQAQRPGAPPRAQPPPQETAQMPPVQRPPAGLTGWADSIDLPNATDWGAGDSAAGTNPASWAVDNPATTQPLSPTAPIAPPTAPTLIAAVPEPPLGALLRGPDARTIIAESPPTTARGFQAPQSYPIQPGFPAALPVQPMPTPPGASGLLLEELIQPVSQPVYQSAPPPAPVVLEVTPRGLGIATVAGYCEELIRRNARLPTEIKKLFTTSRDQQDVVRIVVCQGESRRLDNNTIIGDLVLQNLPRRPRGDTSIEVTFALDASGLLEVRARDAQTGVEQRATLDLVGGVAQDEVATSRDRLQQLRR